MFSFSILRVSRKSFFRLKTGRHQARRHACDAASSDVIGQSYDCAVETSPRYVSFVTHGNTFSVLDVSCVVVSCCCSPSRVPVGVVREVHGASDGRLLLQQQMVVYTLGDRKDTLPSLSVRSMRGRLYVYTADSSTHRTPPENKLDIPFFFLYNKKICRTTHSQSHTVSHTLNP